MKNINTYTDFIFSKLLENNGDKLPLRFSAEFKDMLININDNISNKLLNLENGDSNYTKTYIDIDKDSDDKISFIVTTKLNDVLPHIEDFKNSWFSENDIDKIFNARQRSTMKINRFINEIFNNEYKSVKLSDEEKKYNREKGIKTKPQELEEFVNKYKSLRKPSKFELLKGDDIITAYNYKSYDINDMGDLGTSCMRYDRCEDYIKFYAKNEDKVSLLVLKDREGNDKIIGRALVWKLDEPEGRYFMDRIYTNYQYDVEHFKRYAKENKWLYKYRQNMSEDEYIYDTITEEKSNMGLYVYNFIDNDQYPYMDTLKFYDSVNGTLTNIEDYNYRKLEDTQGGYDGRQQYTLDEMIEMYTESILSDFEYYAQNYFPYNVWNYIDDIRFLEDYKNHEYDYYYDDFENVIDNDFIVKYINNFLTDDELEDHIKDILGDDYDDSSTVDDLNNDQLLELVEKLDIKEEIANEYVNDRYSDYSAKDIMLDLYGRNAVDNLDDDVYNHIENYIDMDVCARDYASNEDEDYLRDLYEN
jgi:hypothetical protein